jgi:hypothetical protein
LVGVSARCRMSRVTRFLNRLFGLHRAHRAAIARRLAAIRQVQS